MEPLANPSNFLNLRFLKVWKSS